MKSSLIGNSPKLLASAGYAQGAAAMHWSRRAAQSKVDLMSRYTSATWCSIVLIREIVGT